MPAVKTREDLQRLALQRGGVATFTDGKKFNTGRSAVQLKPVPAKPAVQAADPAAPDMTRQIVQQSAALLIEQQKITDAVVKALQQNQPAAQVRQWIFDVERDEDNRMTRIVARPEYS